MSEDWLEETYNRSPDKCTEVDPKDLFELAELMVSMDQEFHKTDHHESFYDMSSIDVVMKQLTDPFLSNVKENRKDVYLRAAKMSGINIEFGPAKCGGEKEGYIGLYSKDKGKYDLYNFWERVREIDGDPPFSF